MVEFAPASENISPLLTPKEETLLLHLSGTSKKALEETIQGLIDALTERVKKNRNALEDYFLLGRLYRYQGNPSRALRLHQNLLAHEISDRKLEAKLYVEVGLDMLQAKLDDLGERHLQKALSLEKNQPEALLGLARVFETKEEYEAAAKTLSRLTHARPAEKKHLSFIYAELAKQRFSQGHYVPARRAVEEALRADSTNPYAKLILSDVYVATTRFDKAIKLLSEFLHDWPTHSFLALRRLEDAHYQKDTFTELEDTLREALRRHPDNFYILFSLAKHLAKKKRHHEAQDCVRKTLEANPYYVNAVKEWVSLHGQSESGVNLALALKPFFVNFKRSRRFICPDCGARYTAITWHCKTCGNWDVFNIRYELPAP